MAAASRIKVDATFVEIILRINDVFEDSEKVALWLRLENNNLGGMSPLKLIQIGRADKVLKFIKAVEDR